MVINSELCFYRSMRLGFPILTHPYFPMISIDILENKLTEKDMLELYKAYSYNKEPLRRYSYKGYTIYIYKDEEDKKIYFMTAGNYLACIGK